MNAAQGEAADADLRVLIVCQGHPRLAPGGAENAAYALFEALNAEGGCQAWFLGCASHQGVPGMEFRSRISQPFGERDYVYAPSTADWFSFANRDPLFPEAFTDLIRRLNPNVIHFHGFGNVGVESFAIARRAAPGARIVLTAHDYAAICAHHGLMVTRPDRRLCAASGLKPCATCFPEKGPTGVFVREQYIRHFLDKVDVIVAPSAFLRDRLLKWGIADESVVHVPNHTPAPASAASRREPDGVLKVGYFGRLTLLKGVGVIVSAARLLQQRGDRTVRIVMHGALDGQPEDLRRELTEQLHRLPSNVSLAGAYEPTETDRLMQAMDLILAPSIWWENAPVVIAEALRNRRPVVSSDIGGMYEAVRDGIDGFLIAPGDPEALADLLARLGAMPHLLEALAPERSPSASLSGHLLIYRAGAGDSAAALELSFKRPGAVGQYTVSDALSGSFQPEDT